MQNEKEYLNQYIEFLHNQKFEKIFSKKMTMHYWYS